MRNKKVYVGLFAIIVIFAAILFGEQFFQEEIALGAAVESDEMPKEWNRIIAHEINSKGIHLVVDGQDMALRADNIFMSEENRLMIAGSVFTQVFQCSFACVDEHRVIIHKGTTRIEIELDSDFITVNRNVISPVINAAQIRNGVVYVQSEVLEKGLGYGYKWDIAQNTLVITNNKKNDSILPARFSYMDIGRLPDVKNQGRLSTCWAFAANTALESSLLPREHYTFSVDNMTGNNGFKGTQEDGGECMRAIAYLASWKGPVKEEDDPYGDGICNTGAEAVKHVQEVQIIDSKNFESIKKAVFLYGGVQTSIYTQMTGNSGSSQYYNRNNNAYCYIGTRRPNHDVVIVGWDDNYSKDNFNGKLEGDGAFICMNSWGPDFGNNGLFYVSYYDSNIGMHNVVYTGIESTDNYDNIYQSDLCGWVGQMGYDDDTAYFANVYNVNARENLRAVSFYATGKATEYEIYVVNDYKSTASFANMNFVQKGSFVNSGYYTVALKEPIELNEGSQCAVIVKIKTPGSIHPIAIEYRADTYTSAVDLNDGCGYISLNGRSWEHVEESKGCNICLKMFTDNR